MIYEKVFCYLLIFLVYYWVFFKVRNISENDYNIWGIFLFLVIFIYDGSVYFIGLLFLRIFKYF